MSLLDRRARDVVVVGGSAGAIGPIQKVLSDLPADVPASVFVALHQDVKPYPQLLADVFARATRLTMHTAQHEQPTERGHVYVCPTGFHMVLENGLVRLEPSPRENLFRPSIDVLFRTAVSTYGRRVIGVLLSGSLAKDGVAGLWQVSHRGGIAIVQDPADAEFDWLPRAAIKSVAAHYVLPAAEIGPTLVALTSSGRVGDEGRAARILIVEDESVVATNLQQSLAEMGYDVVEWVPSGEAALGLAERALPDLILMDIHLAGDLNGIETARRIWQKLQIPIVYCTAHADLETLKEVQTTESYGYVVKPFQSGAVRAAVELALARRERELR